MNTAASWPSQTSAASWPTAPTDPRDAMTRDELLTAWDAAKKRLEEAKEYEMDLRKYIVKRAFPDPKEGVNTQELGNGYQLKAGVKYNYTLKSPDGRKTIDAVDDTVETIISIAPNEGSFIVERLFNYSVSLSLTEYRKLCEDAVESKTKAKILDEVNKVLEIKEAAPTLEIKEPKSKK